MMKSHVESAQNSYNSADIGNNTFGSQDWECNYNLQRTIIKGTNDITAMIIQYGMMEPSATAVAFGEELMIQLTSNSQHTMALMNRLTPGHQQTVKPLVEAHSKAMQNITLLYQQKIGTSTE